MPEELRSDELDTIELHVRLIQRLQSSEFDTVIVDVGANDGRTSEEYWHRLPQATLHLFEPNTQLSAGLARPRRPNWHVHAIALGSQSDNRQLQVRRNHGNSTFFEVEDFLLEISPDFTVEVLQETTVKRLDEVFSRESQPITLLKIDTEGYDLEVIKGASGFLERGEIPLVSCEVFFAPAYKNQPTWTDIASELASLGYRLHSFTRLVHTDRGNLYFGDATFISRKYWASLGFR